MNRQNRLSAAGFAILAVALAFVIYSASLLGLLPI